MMNEMHRTQRRQLANDGMRRFMRGVLENGLATIKPRPAVIVPSLGTNATKFAVGQMTRACRLYRRQARPTLRVKKLANRAIS
jgi:hypothetical protein